MSLVRVRVRAAGCHSLSIYVVLTGYLLSTYLVLRAAGRHPAAREIIAAVDLVKSSWVRGRGSRAGGRRHRRDLVRLGARARVRCRLVRSSWVRVRVRARGRVGARVRVRARARAKARARARVRVRGRV